MKLNITYDGQTISVADGESITLKCKDLKARGNIIVEAVADVVERQTLTVINSNNTTETVSFTMPYGYNFEQFIGSEYDTSDSLFDISEASDKVSYNGYALTGTDGHVFYDTIASGTFYYEGESAEQPKDSLSAPSISFTDSTLSIYDTSGGLAEEFEILVDGEVMAIVSAEYEEPEIQGNYLLFSSPESFTLTPVKSGSDVTGTGWNGTLEYSTDAETWSVSDGSIISSSNDGRLYMRGIGNTFIRGDSSGGWQFVGSNISCIGNIENLLDYNTVSEGKHPQLANLQCLFKSCTALVRAPDLPMVSASIENPLNSMFTDCTNLVNIPSLPMTTVGVSGYAEMFYGCNSLTGVVDLRHVETIDQWGLACMVPSHIPIYLGTTLKSIHPSAFFTAGYAVSTYAYILYYWFTDEDTPQFDTTNVVTSGQSKETLTYSLYTDNTVIKDAALAKADEYTTVTVYHLNGEAWE